MLMNDILVDPGLRVTPLESVTEAFISKSSKDTEEPCAGEPDRSSDKLLIISDPNGMTEIPSSPILLGPSKSVDTV